MRVKCRASSCTLNGCIMWLVWLTIVMAVVGFAFDYSLYTYFGKDIPWYGDCIAGFFASPVACPAAVVGFILRCCGMEVPFFDIEG